MRSTDIVIIPARGGSKNIPRKNLRPLAGNPLVSYVILAAKAAKSVGRVVVSTDDEEIALVSERLGVDVIMRPPELSDDAATIDPVVIHAVSESVKRWNEKYRIIITLQPTSPLIRASDIDSAILMLVEGGYETVISAVDDRHLYWGKENGVITPKYRKRVNRQSLPEMYRETGAIIACQKNVLETGTRIGKNVSLYLVDLERSFDIDNISDFFLCESLLERKKIVINVIGSSAVGLGHVYRSVIIANMLVKHNISFVCGDEDDLAYDYISNKNYSIVKSKDRLEVIKKKSPDLVINDVLDTSKEFVSAIKESGSKVVNFEDMGSGVESADLVFNALYPFRLPYDHVYTGHNYFCLRDEFYTVSPKAFSSDVKKVLLCFGGVDEGNLTVRCLGELLPLIAVRDIFVDVIVGPGYLYSDQLYRTVSESGYKNINIVKNTHKISDYMIASDLAITSAGRTVFELASLRIPLIVICQNEREMMHKFASMEFGIVNLGLHTSMKYGVIGSTFTKLIENHDLRRKMYDRISEVNFKTGRKVVLEKILSLFKEY